jgi:patatin-like phospholipase/acyl hydrolase
MILSWNLHHLTDYLPVLHEPDEIFSRDLESWCKDGIQKYKEKDQKCEFRFKVQGGGSCIKRRASHGYEHFDEMGNIAPGSFAETQELGYQMVSEIRHFFVQQYSSLCTNSQGRFATPEPDEVRRVRENVLQEYNQHWKKVFSNKTCLTCLQAVPDHMLNCGHCLCFKCVQDLGEPSDYYEYGWVVDCCILCGASSQDSGHLFRLHPICAGVRALTLDGGGIRGIVELALLEHLDTAIDLDLPLQECFDIIVGTSTGGIIALGLGILPNDESSQKDRPIGALKGEFIDLATKTFRTGKGGALVAALDPFKLTSKAFMALRIWESKYATKPLREGLQRIFGLENNLFSARNRGVRVAVTSAKDNGADKCLIANYNRPTTNDDLDFEREDENSNEMKTWEAALATAAAPFYFKKFEKAETKKNYTDGALHSNFPVQYTLEEIARVWQTPDERKPPLDILLSVGTGIQEREIKIPSMLKIGGFEAVVTSFHNNLDCHRKWQDFHALHMADSLQRKVHRLNAKIEGSYVALDHYSRMKDIANDIAAQIQDPVFASEIDTLANILTASLLFFEPSRSSPSGLPSRDRAYLPGSIRCRLARNSPPLKTLVDLIDSFWYKEIRNDKDLTGAGNWTNVPLPDQLRVKVKTQREWLRVPYTISTIESRGTQQVLAVTLRRPSPSMKSLAAQVPIPISGFPASFESMERKARTL